MTDLPANVDLQWIGKTLLAIQTELSSIRGEQAAIRDEMLVLGARMDRVEAGIGVILAETRAWTKAHKRLSERVDALEGRPA
jgi:hypothetical protein